MNGSINPGFVLTVGLGFLVSCSAPAPETTTTQSPETPTTANQTAIKIDGSSTVYPLSNEVVEELKFERSEAAPAISVEFSGTGGGFRKFCAGETDINGASRPILSDEMAVCAENGVEYLELPVAFDALTVIVHEDNDWAETISVEELAAIWEPDAEGQLTRWQQVRPDWPARSLNLYGADVDSGTYDYFTEAIIGESGVSRKDYTDEVDDARIVRAVRTDPDALGFLGFAYYQESQGTLKALAIDNGSGPVEPSIETVSSGQYRPLTRPLFIYVNKQHLEASSSLQDFVLYYLTNAEFLARTVGYTPLPSEAYSAILRRYDQRIAGTVFDGAAPTNLTLEKLTQLEQ
ncbi:PstS family phosphate ABC transporter substrate-binding protein [Almyronema epifaneia]|uniref:Phosphate-binding protein n=1 Tax=Almyronema epifaneia S1 TaxID=2991925 RepID=A0ABW6ICJ5_9CYAN